MEECSHDVRFNGLCAQCGMVLLDDIDQYEDGNSSNSVDASGEYKEGEEDADSKKKVHILHGSLDIQVSLQEAERVEQQVMQRLLDCKKLSLVIDLDQTILHATMNREVETWLSDESHPNHALVHGQVHKILLDTDKPVENNRRNMYTRNTSHARNAPYFVKFRPGLEQFLNQAKELFELHVYTMGSRQYARQVCQLIDPDKKLFYDRILSRDDTGFVDNTRKSLKRIFPHSDRMVLVLDDRGDVWQWTGNLVPIRPYTFFRSAGDVNAPGLDRSVVYNDLDSNSGPERIVSESLMDNELQKAMNRLSFIHENFFRTNDIDAAASVVSICDAMRKSVLGNLPLFFNGNVSREIVNMAICFGAHVVPSVEESNLIVCGSGYDLRLQELTVPSVSLDWLLESCWGWCMVPVDDYLILQSTDSFTDSDQSDIVVNKNPKRHKHDDTELLEWFDTEFIAEEDSSVSGDSDDIYGHTPDESLAS